MTYQNVTWCSNVFEAYLTLWTGHKWAHSGHKGEATPSRVQPLPGTDQSEPRPYGVPYLATLSRIRA